MWQARPWIIVFQAGCLMVFAGLVLALLWLQARGDYGWGSRPESTCTIDGKIERDEFRCAPLEPLKPIDDPDRIRNLLRPGTTHSVLLKGGFVGRAVDRDFGIVSRCRTTTVAYAFEMLVDRTIESNDGRRIVERLHFERVDLVKLLTTAEDIALDLKAPGVPILAALHEIESSADTAPVPVSVVAKAIVKAGTSLAADHPASKAFLQRDSLSGKDVRLHYVDGIGVESIEPIGCPLSDTDCVFLFQFPILGDAYILPSAHRRRGTAWTVDGSQMGAFLDPSMRWAVSGQCTLRRLGSRERDGRRQATLQVQAQGLSAVALRGPRRYLNEFNARGVIEYSLEDELLQTVRLMGKGRVHVYGQDHLLAGVVSEGDAAFDISYCRRIRASARG